MPYIDGIEFKGKTKTHRGSLCKDEDKLVISLENNHIGFHVGWRKGVIDPWLGVWVTKNGAKRIVEDLQKFIEEME